MAKPLYILEGDPTAPLLLDGPIILSTDSVNMLPPGYRLRMFGELTDVRCPKCNRLICRVTSGADVESVCPRCGEDFRVEEVGASRAPDHTE